MNKWNFLYFFRPAKYDRRSIELSNIERMISVISMFWGLWVLNPFISTFTTSKSYAAMAGLMPEPYWGLAVFLMGFYMRFSWAYDMREDRRRATFLGGIIWMFITFTFLLSNFWGTGTIIYTFLTLYSFWAFVAIPIGNSYDNSK